MNPRSRANTIVDVGERKGKHPLIALDHEMIHARRIGAASRDDVLQKFVSRSNVQGIEGSTKIEDDAAARR